MPEEPWLTLKSTAPAYSFQDTNVKVVDMDEPFPAEVTGGLHENYRQQIPLVRISGVASATALRPYLNDYGYFYRDGHAHVGYAEESMAWAATEGIIGGVSDTALAPGAKATRAQIATMLMRFVEGNG